LAAWGLALAASAWGLPANCSQVQRTVTCTFAYTGSEQTFAVPSAVSSLTVDAIGAPGGANTMLAGGVGGVGGAATATVGVTGGSTVYVEVGGPGAAGPLGGNPGFNGGSQGGIGGVATGGGGGGASDVRTMTCGASCPGNATSLGSRLLVAAGGGGTGAIGPLSPGGVGGTAGAKGGDGSADVQTDTGGTGGGAGTTSGPGAFGPGGVAAVGGTSGDDGTAGGLGQGGAGGTQYTGGGGGGGGYYGGGGGGGGALHTSPADESGGGGGGGGASYAPTGSTAVATTTTPSVTIAYTLPDTTAPTISISSPSANATYLRGATVAASYACADEAGGSGLASCHAPVASGAPIDTTTAGTHSFTVTAADSAGNTASQTVTYAVAPPPAPAPPIISIAAPASGHSYTFGKIVTARYSCADGTGGPGIRSCKGTVSKRAPIDTETPGTNKFTVTATSEDGQTVTKKVTYKVVLSAGGADAKITLGKSKGAIRLAGAVSWRLPGSASGCILRPVGLPFGSGHPSGQCPQTSSVTITAALTATGKHALAALLRAGTQGKTSTATVTEYERHNKQIATLTVTLDGAFVSTFHIGNAVETVKIAFSALGQQKCSPASACR
jgi:hypothetical protein